MYVCLYVCMHHVCIYVYLRMYAYMYVCVYMYVYACMYVFPHIHVCLPSIITYACHDACMNAGIHIPYCHFLRDVS
jgi:hypothetical protein